jgi:lipoate-protein ligase A
VRWRWLDSGDAPGAEQMAVDAGLMARARDTGEATFRVYGWRRPTLSFGRNESVRARFAPAHLAAGGFDAVRRPTGGRVLLHDGDVTYSVTAPASESESVRVAFARINRLLTAGLARLGVDVTEAARGRPLRPGRDACFAEPSAGELIVEGRKLVASAQQRDAGALLQHGSILLVDRQGRIATLATTPMRTTAPAATLEAALGRPVSRGEVRDALRAALDAAAASVNELDSAEARDYSLPFIDRFSDPEWTWRR